MKKLSKLDVVASTLLVGTIGAMAVGQVGFPQPVLVHCPGGTHTFENGPTVTYDPIMCIYPQQCGFATTSVPSINFYYAYNFCASPAV